MSELATKLGLLEGDVAITRRELTRVREDLIALDAEIHERDKAHSARALRVEWLEKQLGDKEEVIDLLRSRLDAVRSTKSRWRLRGNRRASRRQGGGTRAPARARD